MNKRVTIRAIFFALVFCNPMEGMEKVRGLFGIGRSSSTPNLDALKSSSDKKSEQQVVRPLQLSAREKRTESNPTPRVKSGSRILMTSGSSPRKGSYLAVSPRSKTESQCNIKDFVATLFNKFFSSGLASTDQEWLEDPSLRLSSLLYQFSQQVTETTAELRLAYVVALRCIVDVSILYIGMYRNGPEQFLESSDLLNNGFQALRHSFFYDSFIMSFQESLYQLKHEVESGVTEITIQLYSEGIFPDTEKFPCEKILTRSGGLASFIVNMTRYQLLSSYLRLNYLVSSLTDKQISFFDKELKEVIETALSELVTRFLALPADRSTPMPVISKGKEKKSCCSPRENILGRATGSQIARGTTSLHDANSEIYLFFTRGDYSQANKAHVDALNNDARAFLFANELDQELGSFDEGAFERIKMAVLNGINSFRPLVKEREFPHRLDTKGPAFRKTDYYANSLRPESFGASLINGADLKELVKLLAGKNSFLDTYLTVLKSLMESVFSLMSTAHYFKEGSIESLFEGYFRAEFYGYLKKNLDLLTIDRACQMELEIGDYDAKALNRFYEITKKNLPLAYSDQMRLAILQDILRINKIVLSLDKEKIEFYSERVRPMINRTVDILSHLVRFAFENNFPCNNDLLKYLMERQSKVEEEIDFPPFSSKDSEIACFFKSHNTAMMHLQELSPFSQQLLFSIPGAP